MCGRFVVNHFWEPSDPRLFVCEAKLLPDTTKPPISSTLLLNKSSSGQVRMNVSRSVGNESAAIDDGNWTVYLRAFQFLL